MLHNPVESENENAFVRTLRGVMRRCGPKSGIGGESGTNDQQSFALVDVAKPVELFQRSTPSHIFRQNRLAKEDQVRFDLFEVEERPYWVRVSERTKYARWSRSCLAISR